MGDFLSNLVTRNTATAGAVLRPRPVSIYESGPEAQAPSPELLEASEPARGERSAPVSGAPETPAGPMRPAATGQPGLDLAWLESWRKRLAAQADGPAVQPVAAAQTGGSAPVADAPRPAPLPAVQSAEAGAAIRGPMQSRPADTPAATGQIAPRMSVETPRSQTTTDPDGAPEHGAEKPKPATQSATIRPREVVPLLRPAQTPSMQARAGKDEPPPAPVIQVSIGRVEVRMTPAPAPERKAESQAAPVLRLEDYLRLRNGGQR